MASGPLRDPGLLTRLLILQQLLARPGAPLREIADEVELTPQAVSAQLQHLARAGLCRTEGRRRDVTPEGLQFLLERFGEMKRVIDDTLRAHASVGLADAVATHDIEAGQRVGLFMRDGVQVATPDAESSSHGVAVRAATAGHDVVVRDLSGVVELSPAELHLVRVPGPGEGGSAAAVLSDLRRRVKKHLDSGARVGVVGASARVAAQQVGLPLDFEFAPTHAAFAAAELGVPTVLLVSRDREREVRQEVEDRNRRSLHPVPVRVSDVRVRTN